MPQATTTAEKLEMEGEEVNISSIEKKIKEELTDVSERVKSGIHDVSDKVKNADYKKYKDKAKSGSQDVVDTLGRIFTTLFMVFGKFIGVILIIIAVSTIFALLISLVTAGSIDFFHEDWGYQRFNVLNDSGLPLWGISLLTFILVGVPFIFVFLLGIRILSNNKRSVGRVTKLSLLGIWLVALLSLIFFGSRQFVQSAFEGSNIEKMELTYKTSDTLRVKILDNENLSGESYLKHRWGYRIVYDENDIEKIYSNDIRFNIYQTDANQPYLKVNKRSKGRSKIAARENAGNIAYDFFESGMELQLNGYFLTELENKFRDQSLKLDLYIPYDQVIYLDKSTMSFLHHVDNVQDIYDRDMPKHYYKMTPDGLNCLDCDGFWNDQDGESGSFKMNIDEDGVNINITSDDKEKAKVIINENGVNISSSKDTINK